MSAKEKNGSVFKVFGIIFLILLIIMTLFVVGVQIAFKNDNVTPSMGGYSLYLMHNDYMAPDIDKNSLILATNGVPTIDDIGRAVVVDDVKGYGTTVMRLVNITTQDNRLYYELRFTRSADTVMAKEKKIVGIVQYQYPALGKIIMLAKTLSGILIYIGIPLILTLFFMLMHRHVKKSRIEKVRQRREEYQHKLDEINNEETQAPVTLDEFVNEGNSGGEADNETAKESEMLDQPLIEEGVKKDELVEMKEDLIQPTNTAIEELLKTLEEENAKLKEFESEVSAQAESDGEPEAVPDDKADEETDLEAEEVSEESQQENHKTENE